MGDCSGSSGSSGSVSTVSSATSSDVEMEERESLSGQPVINTTRSSLSKYQVCVIATVLPQYLLSIAKLYSVLPQCHYADFLLQSLSNINMDCGVSVQDIRSV